MKISYILPVLFLTLNGCGKAEDIKRDSVRPTTEFAREKVQLQGCSFEKEVIDSTLYVGLNRIATINDALSADIIDKAFEKKLTVTCDVVAAKTSCYQSESGSIHLRNHDLDIRYTMTDFFHGFLHFYGMVHVEDDRIKSDLDKYIYDPVYACLLTAFPEIAGREKIPGSIVDTALATCSVYNLTRQL